MSRKRGYFSVKQSHEVVCNQSLNPKTEQKQTQFRPFSHPFSPSRRQNKPTPGRSRLTSRLASRPRPVAAGRRSVSPLEAKRRSSATPGPAHLHVSSTLKCPVFIAHDLSGFAFPSALTEGARRATEVSA